MKIKKDGWVDIKIPDQDLIASIIEKVKNLSIVEVLSMYGVEFTKIRAHRAYALCPFHADMHVGNFNASLDTNSCYCYACTKGGDAIKAVSYILEKSYVETALTIAVDFKIISAEEFSTLCKVKYERKIDKKEYQKYSEREPKVNVKLYNDVYNAFKYANPLTDKDRKYLKEIRKLSDERIEKDYFSIQGNPTEKVFLIKELLPQYTEEEISTVAGFFLEKDFSRWKLSYHGYTGLGICLRDKDENIRAIQIRTNDENCRYIFFSGKYERNCHFKGGASVGITFDFLFHKEKAKKLAITEGKFKAEKLYEKGFDVISVQGVNNIKGITDLVDDRKIYLFFDADFISNPYVHNAIVKLIKTLNRENIFVIVWNKNDGKGIDDLILNGKEKSVRAIPSKEFLTLTENTFEKIVSEVNIPIRELTNEDKKRLLSNFETKMRCLLSL